ncbi:hypothetical protein SCG7109_AC_00220 [Chlamydiales bacterium SCGC AG-110-M15]|nr:hypothetical protein SCG7109_AC_00220 [Chlamydiales bacterium SCGC AG-110-M15]
MNRLFSSFFSKKTPFPAIDKDLTEAETALNSFASQMPPDQRIKILGIVKDSLRSAANELSKLCIKGIDPKDYKPQQEKYDRIKTLYTNILELENKSEPDPMSNAVQQAESDLDAFDASQHLEEKGKLLYAVKQSLQIVANYLSEQFIKGADPQSYAKLQEDYNALKSRSIQSRDHLQQLNEQEVELENKERAEEITFTQEEKSTLDRLNAALKASIQASAATEFVYDANQALICKHKIFENLSLGSLESYREVSESNNPGEFTTVLSISKRLFPKPEDISELTCSTPPPEGVRHTFMQVVDEGESFEDMEKRFNEFFDFLDQARVRNENILVHCDQGESRSATVLIAYLMNRCGVSKDEALHFLQLKRCVVGPKPSLQRQLVEYGAKLD